MSDRGNIISNSQNACLFTNSCTRSMVPLFLFTDNWLKNSRNLLNCNIGYSVLLSEFRVVGHQSLAGVIVRNKPVAIIRLQWFIYTEHTNLSMNYIRKWAQCHQTHVSYSRILWGFNSTLSPLQCLLDWKLWLRRMAFTIYIRYKNPLLETFIVKRIYCISVSAFISTRII